jgi:hypothetical protein
MPPTMSAWPHKVLRCGRRGDSGSRGVDSRRELERKAPTFAAWVECNRVGATRGRRMQCNRAQLYVNTDGNFGCVR